MINKAYQLLTMALDNDKTGHCLESFDTMVGEVHSKVPYCLHRYNRLPVCDNVRVYAACAKQLDPVFNAPEHRMLDG